MLKNAAKMLLAMCLLMLYVPSIGLGIDNETTKTVNKSTLYRFIPGEVLDYSTTFTILKPGSANPLTYRVNSQLTVLDACQSSASMLCKMSLSQGLPSQNNVNDKNIVFALKVSDSGKISDYLGIAAPPGVAGEPASLFLSLPTVSTPNYSLTYPPSIGGYVPLSVTSCSDNAYNYCAELDNNKKIADGVELSTYTLKVNIVDMIPKMITLKMGVQYFTPGTNQKIESKIDYESALVSKYKNNDEILKKERLELQSLTPLLQTYEKLSSSSLKAGPSLKSVDELLNQLNIHEQHFPDGQFSDLIKNMRIQIKNALLHHEKTKL